MIILLSNAGILLPNAGILLIILSNAGILLAFDNSSLSPRGCGEGGEGFALAGELASVPEGEG